MRRKRPCRRTPAPPLDGRLRGARNDLPWTKPYAEGGTPIQGCNLPDRKKLVHMDATLDDPSDIDRGWSLTFVD